jgi:hypothetical protein
VSAAASRSREGRLPHMQHQRALENEAHPMRSQRQPVEKALPRVVLKQLLEWPRSTQLPASAMIANRALG